MKTCADCGETKPLDQFNRRSASADGVHYYCRSCIRERARRWREENPGRDREQSRRWREENPERVREYTRQHRKENAELLREKDRRWREENPERKRELNRRSHERARAAVFGHYGEACACCGTTDRLTIDHVNGDGKEHRNALFGHQRVGSQFYLWLVANGFPDGLQTLCMPCNQSKGTGDACRLDHLAVTP